MKFRQSALLLALALLLGAIRPAAPAAIIVVAPTSSVAGSFTITQDITFTLIADVPVNYGLDFALDEWVTSDGGLTSTIYTPELSLSLNGGAAQTYGTGRFVDNFATTAGAATPNDGFIIVDTNPSLSTGDTVTVKAGSYTIAAFSGFNPQATQTFTGSMFIENNGTGARVSNIVSVPEPGSAVLLLGGLALLGARRRRR